MPQVEFTLRDYLGVFLRRWWLIALCFCLSALAALFWTSRQVPLYESSANVLINQATASESFDPLGTGATRSYAERLAENEARFLGSGLVAGEVETRLGFAAAVDVETDAFADVLTITAVSEDPAEAQLIAQTYADTYVEVRQARFAADRTETASKLAARIAEIDLELIDATEEDRVRLQVSRRDLADSLDLLNLTVELADDTGDQVIDAAYFSDVPFTPRVNRAVLVGGIVGLMLGAGLVLAVEALDRSVKTREMVESLTPGAPNLALIPTMSRSADRANNLVALRDPSSTSAEAFRTLRAALQYVAVDKRIRVVQVVSPHSAAGKTTVAANLAVTLAAAGQSVAVVDGDLRRPRLHQVFGVPQVPGLTSAIIGAVPIANCVHEVAGTGAVAPLLIPSGPIPPGPAELLGSAAGQRTMEQIKAMVDIVIIDTPPVLAVADTMVLSQYVDASILVVDARKSKRADVALTHERLNQSGAPVVGTVLNRAKVQGTNGYGYGYHNDQAARGWFSRRGSNSGVETLSGSEIPRIEFAAVPETERSTQSVAESANADVAPSPRPVSQVLRPETPVAAPAERPAAPAAPPTRPAAVAPAVTAAPTPVAAAKPVPAVARRTTAPLDTDTETVDLRERRPVKTPNDLWADEFILRD